MTTLYVIASNETNTMKIGITSNLYSRLKAIQGMSPIHLEVIYTQKYLNYERVKLVENNLHELLKSHNTWAEWFEYNYKTVSMINTYLDTDITKFKTYYIELPKNKTVNRLDTRQIH